MQHPRATPHQQHEAYSLLSISRLIPSHSASQRRSAPHSSSHSLLLLHLLDSSPIHSALLLSSSRRRASPSAPPLHVLAYIARIVASQQLPACSSTACTRPYHHRTRCTERRLLIDHCSGEDYTIVSTSLVDLFDS